MSDSNPKQRAKRKPKLDSHGKPKLEALVDKNGKRTDAGIFRRGDRYAVLYRDSEGRQRQETVRTLDEARRLKAARSAAVATGEFHQESRAKLAEYAMEWVERYGGRGRRGFRESTREDYRRDLRRYVLPYLDGKLRRRIGQVTPRDVAQLVGWLCDEREQGRHLADGTVRRIIAPLRACMASAVAEGVIRSNPCTGVALPARDAQRRIDSGTDEDEQTVKALSTDELAAFLTVCPERWRTFFRVLAATGLRWSEATALRWRDVELDGSEPHVRVRRAYVRGRFGPPKSRHGKRKVPIDHALVVELRARRKIAEWAEDDSLVFPATNGEPLDHSNTLRRVLRPAAQEAGVAWAGFHTFRHTCATRLFAEGRNPVQVARWLGHHSPAFTLSVYAGLLDGDLGEPLDSDPQGVSIVPAQATDAARNPNPVPVADSAV